MRSLAHSLTRSLPSAVAVCCADDARYTAIALEPTKDTGSRCCRYNYEVANVKGLYVVGALMHSRDYGTAAGGFIHGFRHLIRAFFHTLQVRTH